MLVIENSPTILTQFAGSALATELRGVAVGLDEQGAVRVVRSGLSTLGLADRLRLAHELADVVGELLGAVESGVH